LNIAMNIDTGVIVVIAAVLIFYLRLIIIQRQRVKQVSPKFQASGKNKGKAKKRPPEPLPQYSVLSRNPRDRLIAIAGLFLIVLGLLLTLKIIPLPTWQPYWWIPTAIGIIAFSWGFKL